MCHDPDSYFVHLLLVAQNVNITDYAKLQHLFIYAWIVNLQVSKCMIFVYF